MSRISGAAAALLLLLCCQTHTYADVPTQGRELSAEAKRALDLIGRSYKEGRAARGIRDSKRRTAEGGAQPLMLGAHVPVLLGKYGDRQNTFQRERFADLLFSGDRAATMAGYYSEVSYGQYSLTGEVYDWLRVPQPQAFYAAGNNGLNGGGARFVLDLVRQADAGVDFSAFDRDGDGYADAVIAVHTGGDAAAGDTSNIHSFKWDFNDAHSHHPDIMPQGEYVTNDPRPGHPGEFIKVNEFTIQPEMNYRKNGLIEVGIFCHEYAHVLGLPDLYDRSPAEAPDSAGAGNWCLMAGGTYGGDGETPEKPVHLSAWARQYLGWAVPTEVTSDRPAQKIPRVEDTAGAGVIFKIRVPTACDEYFLIENRQKVGFDSSLAGAGLLIWHVDECVENNNNAARYKVALMQADGERDLEASRFQGGDKGDPFPGEGGANNPNTNFDGFSNPNSRNYRGHDTGIAVRAISDSSAEMTADLFASRVPEVLNISPAPNEGHIPPSASILVSFSRALDPASLGAASLVVAGSVSGPRRGSFSFADGNTGFRFTPAAPFESGEVVTISVSDKIKSDEGRRIAPRVSQFTVAAAPALAMFGPGGNLDGGDQYSRAIFVADLNGDGLPDLGVAGRNRASLWEGMSRRMAIQCPPGQTCSGDRTFRRGADIQLSGDTYSVQAADMDGDGDLDLVTGPSGPAVLVALNNGDATFQAPEAYPVQGYGVSHVRAADLDGDGDVDVAAAGGGWLSVMRNDGEGALQPPDYYQMAAFADALVAADLDNDGDIDLAAGSSAAGLGKATVFLNRSDATLLPATQYPLGNYTRTLVPADLGGDRNVDLLQVGCCGRHDGYFLRNNGGTFGVEWYGVWGDIATAADLDGDGIVDVALIDTSYNPSYGHRPLLWVLFRRASYELDHMPHYVQAADLDGDGDIDLATLEPSTGLVRQLLNYGYEPSPGDVTPFDGP